MMKKGGCSCGNVRFEIEGELGGASICHCRMCQKAFGNFFAPLVNLGAAKLTYTKANPSHFQSSNVVKRGFCEKCGTPLTYESPDGVAIAIGAFDHPEQIKPKIQFGTECRIEYLDDLNEWPRHETSEFLDAAPYLKEIKNYQYQDEA